MKDRIKILGWSRNGFWLLQYCGRATASCRRVSDRVMHLSVEQLHWLLEGIDLAAMRGHAALQLQQAA